MGPQDPKDAWQVEADDAVWRLGQTLHSLHRANPWPDRPLLPSAMTQLMTELWDQGFSQTEIREAFEAALVAMPDYAAGEERRI